MDLTFIVKKTFIQEYAGKSVQSDLWFHYVNILLYQATWDLKPIWKQWEKAHYVKEKW